MKNEIYSDEVAADVIMPVKNGMPYIEAAVKGIQSQTLKSFRVLVLDNGSTDGTAAYIKQVTESDPRFIYHDCKHIVGLSALRNHGLNLSDAPYIILHDADDISLPERFSTIISAMRADSEIAALGTNALIIDQNGAISGSLDVPTDQSGLWSYFFFLNPVSQPTVVLSRSWIQRLNARYGDVFIDVDGFAQNGLQIPHVAEDYFFFAQLALVAKVVNIPNLLLKYRWHSQNTSNQNFLSMTEAAIKISRFYAKAFACLKGVAPFDTAPFSTHGHRLIKFLGRSEDFSAELKAISQALASASSEDKYIQRRLALCKVYSNRVFWLMPLRLMMFCLRYGVRRAEVYPVLSYYLDRFSSIKTPVTSDDGYTLQYPDGR